MSGYPPQCSLVLLLQVETAMTGTHLPVPCTPHLTQSEHKKHTPEFEIVALALAVDTVLALNVGYFV